MGAKAKRAQAKRVDRDNEKLARLVRELQLEQNKMQQLRVRERIAVFVLFAIFLIAMAVFEPLNGALFTLALAVVVVGILYWQRQPHSLRIKQIKREIASMR